ncbi:MAG: protein kinase [Myxococcales bacterium]|nr:protein kinase [Myxococcales bacterium]
MSITVGVEQDVVIAGRYRVVRELGRGGFGRVFEVVDLNTGGRFALKLMSGLDERRLANFRSEAFAANTVAEASSHVVKVTDAGVDARGAFLVMELLDGETLAVCVEKMRARGAGFALAAALMVLRQVAHALDAAHANKIVHCDVKPENVFLARGRDASDSIKVYVLDFGIAKLRSDIHRTDASTVMGTPHWMPPERHEGQAVPQSDVFSFALLAAYTLVGEPIPRTERQRVSQWAAARRVGLPPSFDVWFERATRDAPSERFASVGQALVALETALAPDTARSPASASASYPAQPAAKTVVAAPSVAFAPTAMARVSAPSGAPSADARRSRTLWATALRVLIVVGGVGAIVVALRAQLDSHNARGEEPGTNATPRDNTHATTGRATSPDEVRCSGPFDRSLDVALRRWRAAMRAETPSREAFADIYTTPAMVRPVSENLLNPAEIAEVRGRLNRDGRVIDVAFDGCRVEREDLGTLGDAYRNARSACGAVEVLTVRATASTEGYACTRVNPGRRSARGEYIVRMRREGAALRICYEAWSNDVDREVCGR